MSNINPIANIIINYVQRLTDETQTRIHFANYKRAVQVSERAINRLPDQDTALMPGICAAYNVAYLAADAYVARLEGHYKWAIQLDLSRKNVANDPCPRGVNI